MIAAKQNRNVKFIKSLARLLIVALLLTGCDCRIQRQIEKLMIRSFFIDLYITDFPEDKGKFLLSSFFMIIA
jgi:hypothetical protein